MLRTSALRATYMRIAVQPVANALLRMGVGFYLVSVVGVASAVAACVVLAFDPFWGGFLVIASGYVDNLDGHMARTTGREGPAGAYLDSLLDRYSDFLFVFGILIYYYRLDALDFAVVLTFIWLAFGTLMGNYAQARAEGLNDSCAVGLWERPEMVIFLGLAGIVNGMIRIDWGSEIPLLRPGAILGVSLIVLAVGANWMALRRLFYGFNKMRRKSPEPPELSSTRPSAQNPGMPHSRSS